MKIHRRSFIASGLGSGALAALGDLAFLAGLPSVSAQEAKLDPKLVRLKPELEPLVKLLEETPRESLLEEVGVRIRRGTTYREIVAALLLAGVRNIQPRPVGFKFHAVLVINSAHLASLASAESDRWLPIFWALDQFKNSQAANMKEGGWRLGAVEEAAVPSSRKARRALIEALDNWDEAGVDVAITGMARTCGSHEIFEVLCRYGVRDFREIGHKEIYVANSFRALEAIGWQHAEPVLRSLAYALLDRDGAKENPAMSDLPADRPFRHTLEVVKNIPPGWLDGKPSPDGTLELLRTMRQGSPTDATDKVIELLNRGVAPQSIFEAYFDGAGELLIRAPGILSLHATTFTNAVHYAWQHCRDEETRKILLLQNAAFLPLFRGNGRNPGIHLDELEPLSTKETGVGAVAEIFNEISQDRLTAARKVLGYLKDNADEKPFADAARRLVFLKGRDSHDYKFSSAVLEDYQAMTSPWRDRYLAASVFYLKGAGEADNELVQRARASLNG